MLTNHQIDLIKDSFTIAVKNRDDLVTDFYRTLFAEAPSVRGLFPDDITTQAKMLAAALHMAVRKLDEIESLIEPLHDLGARHVGYGAKPEHYAVVAGVLVGCLAKSVGPTWTQAHSQAWEAALTVIAQTMLEGAAQATPVPEKIVVGRA